MSDFSKITAVCVDTLNHELAIEACWRMAQHGFADVILFTDEAADTFLPSGSFKGFRVERIATLHGRSAYSNFVLHSLAPHIPTSHALIFQWDGFVLDADRWRAEFLSYDYIGAIWWIDSSVRVGNGGFCLRSSKLMHAVAEMAPVSTRPEDRVICQDLAPRLQAEHGLRFAPPEVAKHFSIDQMSLPHYREGEPHFVCDEPFGFHGFWNFHMAFGDFEILDLIDNRLGEFRQTLLTTWPAAALVVNLMKAGRTSTAVDIAVRCAPLLGMDPANVRLHEVVMRLEKRQAHSDF